MPDKPKIIKTTIRVERSLWNRVRILAVKQGTSAEALVSLALEQLLKKGGK
jgi:hypothetical protein